MIDKVPAYNNLSIFSSSILPTGEAIIAKNLDGIITGWNFDAEIIFGYTEEEAVGKNISIIIPTELLNEESIIISRVKKGEKIEHYETLRRRKDGTDFLAEITVSPVKNKRGVVVGVSKFVSDISERKMSEEKQALLAAIIDSSDDAIVSKNLDGIITSWNRGAENIFGYSALEVIGKHISIIIPSLRLPEEKMILDKIRNGERINHIETVRVTKDGKEIDISLTVSPVKDRSGKIIGASKIARDITPKKEAERQKKLFTEKLQELNIYKDEFMAMASHELKTPLTVAKANLQVLEQVMDSDRQKGLLDKALAQLDKLSDLMADLLDVSKIQSGILNLNLSGFDLVKLFSDTINKVELKSKDYEITLAAKDQFLIINADKERLEQVIFNMLTNAVKYSPYAKKIKVTITRHNNEVIVRVRDWGIGIPKDDLEKIFSRFYRVRGIPSTFSGSGIGLYISLEIIKRHGGNMWAESTVGRGSTFSFSLPLKSINE